MTSANMRRIGLALLLVAVVGSGGVLLLRPSLSRWAEARLVAQVEQHFDSTLELGTLEASIFPRVRLQGRGLVLRKRGQRDVAPLITIDEFTATTSLWRIVGGRVSRLEMTGLRIQIPRGDGAETERDADDGSSSPPGAGSMTGGISVDLLISTDAQLVIAPEDADGTPLVFDIRNVRLEHFSLEGPATFEAELTNPKPRGQIATTGSFGPWHPRAPRLTPVAGDYTLSQADMSVFRGIGGTLDSTGGYDGVLEAIAVSGRSSVPDFWVETANHPMPLETTFEARVDGTNGNTYLDRVSATLGESHIEASGEIAGHPGEDGKTVRLDVSSDDARLEDFVFLVVGEDEAPMLGALGMQAHLELPPGDTPVPDKLRLDGTFTIRRGRFASDAVQAKVDELSRRGQGEPDDESISRVLSDFSGQFTLRDGLLRLPNVEFAVRGATVQLAGSYRLRGEQLDFKGHLRLDAKLSQTVTGFKSFLLKAIDPFFSRHGAGAELPIKIEGTVSEPKFGVDIMRPAP